MNTYINKIIVSLIIICIIMCCSIPVFANNNTENNGTSSWGNILKTIFDAILNLFKSFLNFDNPIIVDDDEIDEPDVKNIERKTNISITDYTRSDNGKTITKYDISSRFKNMDKHLDIIAKYAKQNNIDPAWLMAIIITESAGKADAQTGNCIGLMQLNSTYYEGNLYDPEHNIKEGTKALVKKMNTYGRWDGMCIAGVGEGNWASSREKNGFARTGTKLTFSDAVKVSNNLNKGAKYNNGFLATRNQWRIIIEKYYNFDSSFVNWN